MNSTKSFLTPSDFIDFLESYLNNVRNGGDLLGAYEAGICLYTTVEMSPRVEYTELFRHARMKYEAGKLSYRSSEV